MIQKHNIYQKYESFTNALQALDQLKQQAEFPDQLPDIILLDLNMPILDGWGFLEHFEKLYSSLTKPVKVYIASSSIDEKDIIRSRNYSSVKGFISKPLSPKDLFNTL